MKALIFDMGGVLIDLDLEACKQAYRKLGFSEVDSVLDLCHQKGIFGQMEEGLVSADDFRNYILERSDPGVTVEQIDDALCHILVGIAPYKIELLHRLAAEYDIYMLSNNNPIAMKRSGQMFKEAGFGLDTHFKKCYISCDMKALKPSADFYKRVMEDIGVPSSEMLFIDDSQLNVDAAVAAGLPAIYYKPGTDLDKLITDYLAAAE